MNNAFKAPLRTGALDPDGTFGRVWVQFWRLIESALEYIGSEEVEQVVSDGTDNVFLTLDSGSESFVELDVLVQRWYGAQYGFAAYKCYAMFNPYLDEWEALVQEQKFLVVSTSLDLTLSLAVTGDLSYNATAYAGTKTFDRIVYRKRSLAAKNSTYSRA